MSEKVQLTVELNPTLNKSELATATKAIKSSLADGTKGLSGNVTADVSAIAKEYDKLKSKYAENKALLKMMNDEVKSGNTLSEADLALQEKIKAEYNEQKKQLSEMKNVIKSNTDEVDKMANNTGKAAEKASAMSKAFDMNQMQQAVESVSNAINEVLSVSVEFESTLAAVGAITGFTGDKLGVIGDKARELAVQFGGSASDQLKSFQGILSKLGPQVAENADALAMFGKNVSTLSAASGDDAATSMNTITDSMLQFGLVSGDAAKDAETSTRVINALAASAQVGAAEIPQVGASIVAAGVAAKGAKMSFEETNAAIQVLALGGKTGSEAGTALRNVLGMLQNASGPAEGAMKRIGTSSQEMGKLLTEQGIDVALAKMKQGIDGLGSAAEKNAALMQIFGTENSAAAGIMLENVGKYQEFLSGIQAGEAGTGAAFEQAAMRMNTADGMISRMKATVSDVFISIGQKLGSGLSAVLGFSTQIAPTVTTFMNLGKLLPTEKFAQLGMTMMSTVAPALFVVDAETKSLTFSKNALNMSTIKETASNVLSNAAKVPAIVTTGLLTAAQWALNAALMAMPIVAIVAGVVLLYNKVDWFRNMVNGVGSAIGSVFTFIGGVVGKVIDSIGSAISVVSNVLGAVGSAIGAIFGSTGKSAGETFANEFASSEAKDKIKASSASMAEIMQKNASIKVRFDQESSLPSIISEYEKAQSKINELRNKQKSGGLTDSEQAEFKQLEEKAATAAAKIQEIAPASKGTARTVVDSMGNLKQVYDLNIEKAKEFAKSGGSSAEMANNAKQYSGELVNQANNIGVLVAKNKENKAAIDQANDPATKQKLIDKYNEEKAVIDANKKALINSFMKGGEAGLVTEEAINKIAKTIGVSNEEAKKMLVAKALEDAAKSGKVTEEAINKIAGKFGYSKEKAIELYNEQKKQTAEAEKTANAVQDIGKAYDENKKKLQDQHNANISEYNALKDKLQTNGQLSEAEKKRYSELKNYLEYSASQLRRMNKNESDSNKEFDTNFQEKTKKEKAAADSAYEAAKKKYENNKKDAENSRKDAENTYKSNLLNSGQLETQAQAKAREYQAMKSANVELQRQLAGTKALADEANKIKDTKTKESKIAEVQQLVADLNLQIDSNLIQQKEFVIKMKLDDQKVADEIKRINAEKDKRQIEYEVKLGIRAESELDSFDLNSMESELTKLKKQLNDQLALRLTPGYEADEKSIAELQSKIQDMNIKISDKSKEYSNKLELERIAMISDSEERAKELRINTARKTYSDELQQARGNEKAKLDAMLKFQTEKLNAEQEYLNKKSGLYSTLSDLASEFKSIGFLKEASNEDLKQQKADLQKSREELKKDYQSRTLSTEEYLSRDRELTEKNEAIKREEHNRTGLNWSAVSQAMGKAFEKAVEKQRTKLEASVSNQQALEMRGLEITREIEQLKTEYAIASLQKRYAAMAKIAKKMQNLETEKSDNEKQAATATGEVWTQATNLVVNQFGAMVASGDNAWKAMAKSMFAAAKAMVPTFVTMIFGSAIAELGPIAGPIASGILSITLYGLLAAAEGAIGYYNGGWTGDGDPNEVAGVVHGQEIVIPHKIAKKNKPALMSMISRDISIDQWYMENNAAAINKMIDSEVQSALQTSAVVMQQANTIDKADLTEIKDLLTQQTIELQELRKLTSEGNFKRKTTTTHHLNVKLDKDKFIEATEMQKHYEIGRR